MSPFSEWLINYGARYPKRGYEKKTEMDSQKWFLLKSWDVRGLVVVTQFYQWFHSGLGSTIQAALPTHCSPFFGIPFGPHLRPE